MYSKHPNENRQESLYQSHNDLIADSVVGCGSHQLDHHLADVLRRSELPVLTRGGELAEHILVQVALHILLRDIVLVEVVKPGDDLLKHLRRGDHEYGVAHIAGKGGVAAVGPVRLVGDLDQLAALVKVGQAAVFHVLGGGKDPLPDHVVDLARVAVFEPAPAHRLADGRGRKDFGQARHAGVFQFLSLQFLLVERADEHDIGELFDDGQWVGDAARPDVRSNLVHFVSDRSRYHTRPPCKGVL